MNRSRWIAASQIKPAISVLLSSLSILASGSLAEHTFLPMTEVKMTLSEVV